MKVPFITLKVHAVEPSKFAKKLLGFTEIAVNVITVRKLDSLQVNERWIKSLEKGTQLISFPLVEKT